MKRTTSLTLIFVFSLSLLASFAGITGFAADNSLKAIVAADLHFESARFFGNIENSISLPDSELYKFVRYNGQLIYESEAIIRSFFEKAADSDAECILIPGDLVNGGYKMCHLELAAIFKDFERSTGKEIFVSVGNHDCKSNTTMSEFENIYSDFGFSQSLSRDEDTLSYTADLGGDYRLISISSATYDDKSSVIGDSTMQWIKAQCETAKKDGKHLVAMTHYGVLQHAGFPMGHLVDAFTDARIENADNCANLFADWGIKYIFTGHVHINDISKKITSNNNEIYDVVTSALVGYPCTYRLVHFSDSGVEFKANYITDVDAAYLPAEFSDLQLEKIANDFQGYARGMVGASIQHMLHNFSVNPNSAVSFLTVDPESKIADIIRKLIPHLYEVSCLPIYKTQGFDSSFEELAESYGGVLPKSDFKTFFELAGFFVSTIMAGDENITAQSTEMRLFLECFKAALVFSFDGVEKDVDSFLQSYSLPFTYSQLKTFGSKLAFRKTTASKLVSVFFSPLIEKLTVDDNNPSDLNVTLPAYITAVEKRGVSFWLAEIIRILRAFFTRFFAIMFS